MEGHLRKQQVFSMSPSRRIIKKGGRNLKSNKRDVGVNANYLSLVSESVISSILPCLAYPLLAPFLTPFQPLFLFAPTSPSPWFRGCPDHKKRAFRERRLRKLPYYQSFCSKSESDQIHDTGAPGVGGRRIPISSSPYLDS